MTRVRVADGFRRHSVERRAFDLLEHLRRTGGSTANDVAAALGWTPHQFRTALDYARNTLCPAFEVAIPHPVPDDGFQYHLTGEWISVDGTPAIEAGTSYALGRVEAQLRSIRRDVRIARANLDRDNFNSVYGQKVRYLDAHLSRIFQTLDGIGSSVERHDGAVA